MLEGGTEAMSSKIDQRIVEMSFENHKFEDGIKKSKNSLKEFSNALQNMGTGKDFKGLENSVHSISQSFTMLEQIGIGALRRIGEAALNAGTQLIKSLTIDPLSGGWTKYEQKTASVQTIMNATGKSIDEVNGYLDKLMWFSDETSYGFTDMTAALAQMTSSGGDIDKLIPLITGVANATAYAGKGAGEFSRAMYNLNQSYGMGNLQFMDWRSLELAGVAGKELKQIFIDTGKSLGVLDKEGKTAKGTLVDIGTFGSTLQEKWADTRVMEAAFGKFSELSEAAYELVNAGTYDTAAEAMEFLSGKYSEVAEKGFKSAQQAKSFSEAIAATLDAVSSGWMRTYEVIFGHLPEATANFSALTEVLWTIFASGSEARNEMLQMIKDAGGVKSVFQSIKNIGVALLKPLKAISQAFDQFFPPKTLNQWVGLIKMLETITKKLIMTDATADKIRRTFAGFFAVVDLGWRTIRFLGRSMFEILGIFVPLNGTILDMAASLGDFLVIVNQTIKRSGVFEYGLLGIKIAVVLLRNMLTDLVGKVTEFLHVLWTTDKPLEYLGKTIAGVFSGVIEGLQKGINWISTKFMGALSSIQKFFGDGFNMGDGSTLVSILTTIKDFVYFLVNEATGGIANFGEAIGSLDFNKIATFVTGGVLLLFVNQLSHLTGSMANLLTSTNSFVTKFTKKMFGTQTKIRDLAVTFGILSASLFVLSRIPWEDLKHGLAGLAGAMLIFVAAYGAIQAITVIGKMKLKGADAMASGLNLMALAGGLAIMSIAVQKISKIDESKVWKSVAVVGAMMGIIAAYQSLTVAISLIPGSRAANVGMSVMASGLLGMIGIVVLLDHIDPTTIAQGLAKLATSMMMLAGIQALFALAARVSGGNKVSVNIFGMAAGILAMIGVIKILNILDSREIIAGAKNVLLMGGILSAVQIMFSLAARISKGIKFKTNIFAMQMGIVSMIALTAILGKMDQTNIQNGIKNLAKMSGIIAALEILTALAARLGGGHKLQKILGSVSMSMLSFTLLIGVLGMYKETTIDKGLKTIVKMAGIIVALEALTALIGTIPGTAKGITSLIGIVIAIVTLTGSLAMLAVLDQDALSRATDSLSRALVSVGVMAAGLGAMIKVLSRMSVGFGGLKKIVQTIIPGFIALGLLLTSALAFLAVVRFATPMMDNISWASIGIFVVGIGVVAALVTGFTLLTKIPGLASGGKSLSGLIPGFVGMGALILATAGMFYLIGKSSETLKNLQWSSLQKFTTGVDIISGIVTKLTLLSPVLMLLGTGVLPALTGLVAVVLGVGLVVAAFAGLSAAMEYLFSGDTDFLIRGINKLVLVGEGIGRFIGAIAGGFSSEALTGYGDGLAGFAESVSKINAKSFDGIEGLAKAVLALTGASLLDGLSRIVNLGKNPGEIFGEQIKSLLSAFEDIKVETATNASNVINALAPMLENFGRLTDAAGDIPNSGGLLGDIFGENNLDTFGLLIKDFIANFEGVTTDGAKNATDILAALAPMATNLKTFAKAADKIPNSGGFLGAFMGNNDIDDFGLMLASFISIFSVIDIENGVNKATATLMAMTPMMGKLKEFAEVAGTIPDSGGMITWFMGDNDIKSFTEDLTKFIKSFGTLDRTKVQAAHANISLMSISLLPGLEKFVTLFNRLNATGGYKQSVEGNKSFANLANEIKSFVNILKNVDISVVAPALESLAGINEAFRTVGSDIIASAITSLRDNKTPFQTEIITLLDGAITLVNNKRNEVALSFTALLDKALADSRQYIGDFRTLGYDIVRGLQNGITSGQNYATYAADTMAGAVINTARNTLEVRSPSRVFAEIGKWLPIGLGNGIKRNSGVAALASVNMAHGVEDAIRNTLEVHSESPKFNSIGEWVSKSLGIGIDGAKGAVLNTAKELGLDTSDMTVKGITEGLTGGEGAVTSAINSLLELLTGKKTAAEVAAELGIETGDAIIEEIITAADTNTNAVTAAYGGMGKDAFQAFKESIDKRKEYNLMSAWEEIEAWQNFAKKYAEGTAMRLKADKEVGRLRWEYSKTWIDKEKYYKRLSLEEELTAWENVQARYEKGHEYRLQAEREIFRLKEEIWQAEYQHSLDYIDDEKYYGRMNLSEELDEWKKIANMTEDNSDERKKADREIFRLENDIRDANLDYEEKLKKVDEERTERRKKAADEYYAKEKEINDKLARDIQTLTDTYESAVNSRTQTLYSTYGLFDEVEKPKYVSGFELINNLEDQNTAFDKWQNSIGVLAAKGVDDGLVKELRDMGPKSLAQINALNRLSDSELSRYVDLWQKKSQEAKDQAVSELQSLKEANDKKIQELTAATAVELTGYKNVWAKTLDEIDDDTKLQLNQIQTEWESNIGSMTETGITLIKQFKLDWFGEIATIVTDTKVQMSELKNITESVKPAAAAIGTAINTTLNNSINTESTGKNIVTGIATGIKNNTSTATKATTALGNKVYSDINSFWMIQSPSRKTMETGKFIVMGLADGMRKFAGLASAQGQSVGEKALDAMSVSMSSIPDLLGDDLGAFTITPVLDLSGIQAGAGDVNALLNGMSGLDLSSTMRLLPKTTQPNQNGILSEIRNGLLSMVNPQVDLTGKMTVEVVNDKGEIVGIAETAIKDLLRRESR
jgi:hypothetical protein